MKKKKTWKVPASYEVMILYNWIKHLAANRWRPNRVHVDSYLWSTNRLNRLYLTLWHWWITFHKRIRPSIYFSLMSFLSMKSKVKAICLQLSTHISTAPHVEKIVRKGLGSKRSVGLGRVMRRSTLRFPSVWFSFKIWNCSTVLYVLTQMSKIFCVLQDHREVNR